jgi:DNA-binding CsgD family transcriptional regulator/tetratricopeptide (TPR) repeat protein
MSIPEHHEPSTPERVERLNAAALEALEDSPGRAVELAQEALALAQASEYGWGIAAALRVEGMGHHHLAAYESAVRAFTHGLDAARRNHHDEAELGCLNGLGVSYRRLGELDGALECLLAALELARKQGHERGLTAALVNVGLVYDELGEFDDALRYHEAALQRVSAHSPDRVNVLLSVGLAHERKDELIEAEKRYAEALEAARAATLPYQEARLLVNLGLVNTRTGRVTEGLRHLEHALALAQRLGLGDHEAHARLALGQTYLESNNLVQAQLEAELGLARSQQIGHKKHRLAAYGLLSVLFKARGEYARALDFLERKTELETELYRGAAERRTRALLSRFELNKALLEAEVLRLRNVELAEALEALGAKNTALRKALYVLDHGDTERSPFNEAPPSLESSPLSPRELEVLRLVGEGCKNKQIAQKLGISAYTARHHLSSILSKLSASSRSQAVAVALQRGWL